MIVEVVAVGTELLLGQIVNTNAAEIGRRLAEAGLDHHRQSVVGDNLHRVVSALQEALGRAEAVIVTGGLGPTPDDLTREALAAVTGRPMVIDQGWVEELGRRWEAAGREMPESNLRQAQHPEGARLIPNPKGSAPGLMVEVGDRRVFALPGVPEEMLPMLEDRVLPELSELAGDRAVVASRVLRSWGMSEAKVAELLDDLFHASTNPTLAFLASAGEIRVRITAKAANRETAGRMIEPIEAEVRRRLGDSVFAVDRETVEEIVLAMLEERSWGVATAESATGGMVAARLTGVPGASRVVRGGVVAYTDFLKESLLDVSKEVMARHGAVSEETALAMAEGAAARLDAEVVVAVTGSAGPDPREKPAGTMVVAVRTPEDRRGRTLRFPGDRERVRTYTTTTALHLVRLAVEGTWWSR